MVRIRVLLSSIPLIHPSEKILWISSKNYVCNLLNQRTTIMCQTEQFPDQVVFFFLLANVSWFIGVSIRKTFSIRQRYICTIDLLYRCPIRNEKMESLFSTILSCWMSFELLDSTMEVNETLTSIKCWRMRMFKSFKDTN